MEQKGKISDLDPAVEKLDREEDEGEEDASGESYDDSESDSEIDDEEDIENGLLIYDCPPSEDTKRLFQHHFPSKLPVGCVEYESSWGGQWMLFFPVWEIDDKWEMAKKLFDTGQLMGVRGLSVSTAAARYSPRSSDPNTAVINMFCGPWNDGLLMEKIGRNLAHNTKYRSDNYHSCMYYKTEEQTRGGTSATGQAVNHKYKIEVQRRY